MSCNEVESISPKAKLLEKKIKQELQELVVPELITALAAASSSSCPSSDPTKEREPINGLLDT